MEPMYAVVRKFNRWIVTVVSARDIQAGIENKGMCDLWDLEGRMRLEGVARRQTRWEALPLPNKAGRTLDPDDAPDAALRDLDGPPSAG